MSLALSYTFNLKRVRSSCCYIARVFHHHARGVKIFVYNQNYFITNPIKFLKPYLIILQVFYIKYSDLTSPRIKVNDFFLLTVSQLNINTKIKLHDSSRQSSNEIQINFCTFISRIVIGYPSKTLTLTPNIYILYFWFTVYFVYQLYHFTLHH